MEYTDVKEWLDNIVKIHKMASFDHVFSDFIRASFVIDNVLVYDGIEILADMMGLELSERKVEPADELKYEYSFVYDGVTFVSYRVERLERFVHMQ